MTALLVSVDPELISDIIFPEIFHTQIIIPANAIIFQRNTEGKYCMHTSTFDRVSLIGMRVPVVNFIADNLQSYLNNRSIRYHKYRQGEEMYNAFVSVKQKLLHTNQIIIYY